MCRRLTHPDIRTYAADVLGEDEDEKETVGAVVNDEEAIDGEGASDEPAAVASAALSSQQQPLQSQDDSLEEEPHLQPRWRDYLGID